MTPPDTVREAAPRPVSCDPPREGGPRFWLGLGLRLAGLLGLSFVCGLGAFAIDVAVNGHQSPTALTRQVGRGAMGVLGLLYVCRWARQAQVDWRQMWGRRPMANGVVYCASGGALLCMCHETSILALRGQLPLAFSPADTPWIPLGADILTGGLLIAVYEESLFRGLLPCILAAQRYGSAAVALLTTFLFALLHVDLYLAPLRLLWIAVLGFAAIVARRKSGSLLACMILHLSHNTVGLMLYWVSGPVGR